MWFAAPYITNDAVVFGLLMVILATIMYTSQLDSPFFKKFYTFIPTLFLCYFVPALFRWPLGLISGEESNLYFVASRYLLPASLVFLCLNIDLKGLVNLGSKSLIMFFTATVGVILGGPIALLVTSHFFPNLIDVDGQELWRGLATIAGSWIGGGANQTAMKEIYEVSNNLFGTMVVIDITVANIWLGFLLYGVNISDKLDRWLKADASSIEMVKKRVQEYNASIMKIPTVTDVMVLLGIGFGAVGLSHFLSDVIVPHLENYRPRLEAIGLNAVLSKFFWLVILSTTIGFLLSFTKARKLEGAGASRLGSIFIYILVATIGINMDLKSVFDHLGLFVVGLIWMSVHISLLLIVAKIIRAPFFFVAVGSQANIGGAASAPIVASAFDSALAPVGVLMAVLGYILGTYGAILCAQLMSVVPV